MDFAEYIRRSDVSGSTKKFIMANFYEIDFLKGIVILVNVDEMCKILKSLQANSFWSRDKGGIE